MRKNCQPVFCIFVLFICDVLVCNSLQKQTNILADWNYSAPHGAGRIMSRSGAKEKVTLTMFKQSMEGIYTTSVNSGTIDESCFVYKDMQEIVSNITDAVEVIDIIKPIYNFKSK